MSKTMILSNRRIWLCLLCFLLAVSNIMGQGLKMKVLASKDSVSIRWSPSNYSEWIKGNKYGYKVERYLVSKDGKIVDASSRSILHEGVIRPLDEKGWMSVVRADSAFAPVALQALWGETFELSSSFKTNLTELYNKVKENESRFGFAMYCADRSLVVAKALGVYFVDRRIKVNERYVYRVFANTPTAEALDTAYAVVDPLLPSDLLIPERPSGQQLGGSALITWGANGFDYVGYHVERSDDGRIFKSLTKDLVVPFLDKGGFAGYFADSTLKRSGKYFYRIVGVTPFQKRGPYSDTLTISISKEIPIPERVVSSEKNGRVVLKWDYDEGVKSLSHFGILKSMAASGPFVIVADKIGSEKRTWMDESSFGGYYKVVAFTKAGDKSESLETFTQLNDDTPPTPPVGLTGTVDSLGIIRLKWTPNTEKDLLGYRIFRSNSVDGEFTQLNQNIIERTSFVDTVALKTLTRNVFYKLAAVDKRYNSSLSSITCRLSKPDIVKPSPPIIASAKCTSVGMVISWQNSPSSDLKSNNLYRIQGNDTLLVAKPVGISSIVDALELKPIGEIKYYMMAVDSAGNHSAFSNTVSVRCKNIGGSNDKIVLKGTVTNGEKGLFVLLEWNLPQNAKRVLLYKSVNKEKLSIYKTLMGEKNYFDNNVIQGSVVHYMIRIEMEENLFLESNKIIILL